MARYNIVLKPGDRTVLAGAGSGGGANVHSSAKIEFKKHTDGVVKVTVEADHLAYEAGFVILYDESPYDPIFVTSRDTLHAIYRTAENAPVSS